MSSLYEAARHVNNCYTNKIHLWPCARYLWAPTYGRFALDRHKNHLVNCMVTMHQHSYTSAVTDPIQLESSPNETIRFT